AGIGVVWCFKLLGTLLGHEHSHDEPAIVSVDPKDINQDKQPLPELKNVSVATALVLALHKIPEGIVMFASAVANPQFGAFVALSLIVHNIPEALAISLPMHAAGFWLKEFVYAMAVGVMQPIGAGLGYLLVSTVGFSDLAQGLVYAPLSAMLTYVVVSGMLPAAFGKGSVNSGF
ncbi:hypothetical protein MP638_006285, partial [Amoeboaphelidium occidentale]